MGESIDQRKQELLDKVHALIANRMSGEKARRAQLFTDHYYRHTPPEDILDREPEDLYGAALSMWAFGQERTPGRPKIRVYNPRFEEHGWHSTHTVIEVVNDNMPFLVDSVTMELARQDLTVHLVVHPIFGVERDANGVARDFPSETVDRAKLPRESFMHVEIDEQSAPAVLEAIEEGLAEILVDVRAAVEDWQAMRDRAAEVAATLSKKPPKGVDKRTVEETAQFMQWLHDDHFTFMGYREVAFEGGGESARLVIDQESGLGVLRDSDRQVFEGLRHLGTLPVEIQETMFEPTLVRITKANRRSTVHRRVHMDTIAIKTFDAKGKPVGEKLFTGLLTSVAYNQSPREIPLLRQKVEAVIERSGFETGGHSAKALTHILESYPRDELFQIEVDQLYEIAMGILHLQERQRIALFLRPDPFQRYVSAIVYVPRERFATALRRRIGEILAKELDGGVVANYTHMSDEALSRVQFIIKTTPGNVPEYDRKALEAKLREETRTWEDKLRQAMVENHGEERGLTLLRKYAEAFPVAYTEHFNVQTAAFDIDRVEGALETGGLGVSLYHPIETEKHQLRLKVYHPGGPMVLSAVMPMLENMGLRVMEEQPFEVRPDPDPVNDRDGNRAKDAPLLYMHDFALETHGGRPVDFHAVRDVFHDSFLRVWNGEIEDDGFNRLVLTAGLGWRDVVVLRAYSKYLRQAAIPFSQEYMEETLASNGAIARALAELFRVRFDPDYSGDRGTREEALVAEVHHALDAVSNLDEDRIIRRFLNLIRSTLRTNFFQPGAEGGFKPIVSFKLASREIEEIPQPAPLREIFVYSPRFEAVHLRFGLVARGGLRWSDRREDFRTEILGLVKAQQVKNAVIVPVGSKGGFVLKKAPPASDREAFLAEGVACYKLFIAGMLDITDNLVTGDIRAPEKVVRWDGDDPYLVVAADKGTATFSDHANAVSQSYGFWLGDAFASGGSAGYDHKKMGITARGGWEAVKRHFREMGHDTQSEDFTVIGVGDMGGDVFGNGMLLSEHIRLVAAFNHLHVFIDPDPDAAAGFKERKRLFEAVKGWDQYDTKLISKGGGVFERKAKSVKLTPEIKQRFDIDRDELTPNQLIKAILGAEADLLWFGGIGTYVKHSEESNADVGDRANDAIRVDGGALRVKVIGEGANLGITHRGRIEFARAGGRINTDAIDNSAGVDCSDHEVNIKILLGDVVARGDMTEKQRNQLLEKMTAEVGALVLRDNYQQTQSVSVTQARAATSLDRHQRLIRAYERAGDLDRDLEFLPDDEEIAERMQKNQGLTRPELAVILAYAKNITYRELLESDLPDDPVLEEDLFRYFPKPLRDNYAENIAGHRLRREIIATSVTNSMINRTGPSFINEMQQRTGRGSAEIARAYTVVREVFGLRDIWARIEGLDNKISASLQNKMLRETGRTVERMTEWFLRNEKPPIDIKGAIDTYETGVRTLQEHFGAILSTRAKQDIDARIERFGQEGAAPRDLVTAIAQLKVLSSACDVVKLAAGGSHPVKAVGQTYSAVGARFGLDWLRSAANRIPSDNQWHRMALGAIIDDLWGLQGDLAARILQGAETGEAAIAAWVEGRHESVERIDGLLAELDRLPQLDLAMLAVVTRELRTLTVNG
ncbi:NAD-glutamate dehydrogenase [Marivibrio halodurans]|uniref:NAD-glutamate dehydrogenase n=1 Tax=Marivibrio halodurans TaxID=2039722 RepID=A0A8J7S0C7_9PROT|nr:NAD-glutamate dehydrogenase [Marivibrio halodurans]MBP5857975.1 NAD-glutamate dehydrogenase [Marivibrio halodurans]